MHPTPSSSAIVNNTLYLLGGIESIAPSSPSTKVFAIDLARSFDTKSFTLLPSRSLEYQVPNAQAAPFKDSSKILLAGTQNVTDQLAVIYDTAEDKWSFPARLTILRSNRSSVGVALDESTGFHVLYGGLHAPSNTPDNELDILDPNKGPGWMYARAQSGIKTLLNPIMLYIPAKQKTLIIGGCPPTEMDCFRTAYLVRTALNADPLVEVLSLQPPFPPFRTAPCAALIDESRIMIYGGRSENTTQSDIWILNITDETWSQPTINNLPANGREGAACVKGVNKQIIVAGGVVTQNGTAQYADPQLAVLNMDTMTWTTQYTVPTTSTSGISMGVWIGIGAGVAAVLTAVSIGIFFWRRRRQKAYALTNSSAMEISTLGSSSPVINNGEASLVQKSPTSQDTQSSNTQPTKQSNKERLPLIISPYRPPPSPHEKKVTDLNLIDNSRISVAGSPYLNQGSSYAGSQSLSNLPSSRNPSPNSSSTVTPVGGANWGTSKVTSIVTRPRSKPAYSYNRDSERLDLAARDAQHQAYAKQQMLEDLRRDFPPSMRQPPLERSGTVYHYLPPVSPEEPDADLTSTVLALRPIELGEESGAIPVSSAHAHGTGASGTGALGGGGKGKALDDNADYGMAQMIVSEFIDSPHGQVEKDNEPASPSVLNDPRFVHLNRSGTNSQTSLIHNDHPLDFRR
ncbi:F-box only protein 42 [Actinomortierella wolfii]|nr:F-box only protein 42 [Actinomortierella wolfii]